MSELVQWDAPPRDVVDGWVSILSDVAELSRIIAGTEFVPEALRGRPAAVGAAILAGRELGIGPMTSLRQLHVIKGAPSMSALLMRALVQSAGHRIRVVESTGSRCTMLGQRSDDDEPTRVTYTADDARLAGLLNLDQWKKRPRAMLLARATGELCRSTFADVIVGIPYTSEELASESPSQLDGAGEALGPEDVAAVITGQPKRIVARKSTVRKPPAPAVAPEPAPADEPPAEPASASQGGAQPVEPVKDERPQPDTQPEPDDEPADRADVDPDTTPASREQQRLIFKLLGDLGQSEPRERRIEITQALIARRVQSLAQVTIREASVLIDTLTRCAASADPAQYLDWLVNSGLDHLRLVESREGDDLPNADVQPIDRTIDEATARAEDPGFDDDPR
jgi:hypothetical protein